MSKSPFIPLYTSDFLGGTGGMTAGTKGVYITLLCLMYETEQALPQQWDTLARRCGCPLPAFKKAIQSLTDDGKLSVSDGGIWSEKCEKHITQRRERSESAASAAKKRWQKSEQIQGKSNTTASVPQCKPEPEPEPEPEPKKERVLKYSRADAEFDLSVIVDSKTAQDFVEHRWAMKKPLTKLAVTKMVAQLQKHSDPKAVLDASVMNNWQGIFPEKVKSNGNYNTPSQDQRPDPALEQILRLSRTR